MVRAKIFLGTLANPADKQMNEWLDNNPTVKILKFSSAQGKLGDHSLSILYNDISRLCNADDWDEENK